MAALASWAIALAMVVAGPAPSASAEDNGALYPGLPGTGAVQAWMGATDSGWGRGYPVCMYHTEGNPLWAWVVACSDYARGGSFHGYSDLWVRTDTGMLIGGYGMGGYRCLEHNHFRGILTGICNNTTPQHWIFHDDGKIESAQYPGWCVSFGDDVLFYGYQWGNTVSVPCNTPAYPDRLHWALPAAASGTDLPLLCDIPGAEWSGRSSPWPPIHDELARAPSDHRMITWNMQGSCHNSENKWNDGVKVLLNSAQIVALQEAGTVPASRRVVAPRPQVDPRISEFTWGGTATRPGSFIYWLQTDPNGNRVNIAIVSHVQADEAVIVDNPRRGGRPALGIRLGNTFYFSVHAGAYRNNDAPQLVAAVDTYVNNRRAAAGIPYQYAVAGDFNRAPNTLPPPPNTVVHTPDAPTHSANDPQPQSTFDYLVSSVGFRLLIFSGAVLNDRYNLQPKSDHFPVAFR